MKYILHAPPLLSLYLDCLSLSGLKEAFFLFISTNVQSLLFNSLFSRNVTNDKEVVESLDLIVNSGKALEASL